MAHNKNQHFVPQFLLKNFSVNENRKSIHCYNLGHNRLIENASIKGQAQSENFYGKGFNVDEALTRSEQIASVVIRKIITTNKLPNYGTDDYACLHIFVMMKAIRTKAFQDEINDSVDKHVKAIIKHDKRFQGEIFEKLLEGHKFIIENAVSQFISRSIDRLQLTYDLKCKLVINESKLPFLISDNPVARYNQFLKRKNEESGTTGFACLGLQIILPISPRHCLVFYDADIYNFGQKNYDFIKLKHDSQVKIFNLFQIFSADQNVYFNQFIDTNYIQNLIKIINHHRNNEKNTIYEYQHAGGSQRTLLHISGNELNAKMQLPFFIETKRANKYVLGDKVVHLRDHPNYILMKEDEEKFKNDGELPNLLK